MLSSRQPEKIAPLGETRIGPKPAEAAPAASSDPIPTRTEDGKLPARFVERPKSGQGYMFIGAPRPR